MVMQAEPSTRLEAVLVYHPQLPPTIGLYTHKHHPPACRPADFSCTVQANLVIRARGGALDAQPKSSTLRGQRIKYVRAEKKTPG